MLADPTSLLHLHIVKFWFEFLYNFTKNQKMYKIYRKY